MNTTILTIAQQKGGAGKTTLAAQLAVALVHKGNKVGIIDIDPQGSLTAWHNIRQDRLADKNTIKHCQSQGWRLKREIDILSDSCDVIIIDAPPHMDSEATISIRAADLVLIPMQPSPMDLWACTPTIETAHQEGSAPLVILNRVDVRTRLHHAIQDKVAALNADLASTQLGNRVAFASSMLDGQGILETATKSVAAKEIRALADEILLFQKKSKSRQAA